MEIIRIPRIMQETSRRHLLHGKALGFVPTMGALHRGHLSLVSRARDENEIVCVSIFVNPLQFGPNEDLARYPRDIEGDVEKLRNEGVHILFMPDTPVLYHPSFSTYVNIMGLSERLCGAFRPGHFTGVATVVSKLFNIVMPRRAYFGQKDFQQTVVISRMVEDLNMDVKLVVCPTIRESDGLAMSSRNVYLDPEERRAATVLYRVLQSASQLIRSGLATMEDVKRHLHANLEAEKLIAEIQYAGLYDVDTLEELTQFGQQNLIALAVKIGDTRLIDNMLVGIH